MILLLISLSDLPLAYSSIGVSGFLYIFLLTTAVVGRNQAILFTSGYICYIFFQETLFVVLGVSWREVTRVKVKETSLKQNALAIN